MFSKNPNRQGSGDVTFIAAECQITGTVTIKGSVRIDGKLDGSLLATDEIVIGPSALLKANIEARTVSIAGEVHGDIQTTDTLELNSTARLYGDICTRQFRVEQGARFVGTSRLYEENGSTTVTPFPEQRGEESSAFENGHRQDKRRTKTN
ncbi:MAG: bactofilin family protein [Desulfitobacteriaceae bacterium]